MPAARFGPSDLLEYNAQYRVLICRQCQYAIQKSALRSHLLRHKIYRDERKRLLGSIARLDLSAPSHVSLPPPHALPINALPITSGYRCAIVGCDSLCVSWKRMRRHQSEIHGHGDLSGQSTHARPVMLQTFFRGTKLRYFEVTPLPGSAMKGTALTASTDSDGGGDEPAKERSDGQRHNAFTATPALLTQRPPSPANVALSTGTDLPAPTLVGLDLEVITYFHHFIIKTSLTLPVPSQQESATHYWQTAIVNLALQRQWLMYGLLIIAAYHMVALSDDDTVIAVHAMRAAQLRSEFDAGWQDTLKHALGQGAPETPELLTKAGKQLDCLIRCATWCFHHTALNDNIELQLPYPFDLHSLISTIRAIPTPNLDIFNSAYTEPHNVTSTIETAPTAVLNHLHALPHILAQTLGKPSNTYDVLVTLSAIASLVDSCNISYASEDVNTAWHAMAMWVTKLPDHFLSMIECDSPGALVVVGYWAGFLVRRAEDQGCWFLKGLGERVVMEVGDRLAIEGLGLRDLIEENLV